MISMQSFFRNTPPSGLRNYFEHLPLSLPPSINWSAPTAERVRTLIDAFDEMPNSARARITNDAERISGMSDEAGQSTLYSVCSDRVALDGLGSAYGRSVSVFVNSPSIFSRAEEARFTDEHRRGRMWDGFVGPSGITPRRDETSVANFESAIQKRFESPNVHIEIFDRLKPKYKGEHYDLVQVTVYLDGRPDEVLEFVGGTLDRRPRRPVAELVVTYEPTSGAVEVVANDKESRADLARIFVKELLGSRAANKALPLRRYDLGVLTRHHDFSTDPEDRIDTVQVNELRLTALDSDGDRLTLECRGRMRTIWEMASQHFGFSNPLVSGWKVTRAKITIAFRPIAGASRGRRLPLTVKIPHGCDLKDQTEGERAIGEKYLQQWRLLKDV